MATKKYRVLIEGGNILINVERRVRKLGFFTTRYVEANDALSAQEIAIDLIKNELNNRILNEGAPPLFIAKKVEELTSFGNQMVPGKGFSWFPES